MTDRFPLILDTSNNRIKELPSGDNLDLQGCGIVNANSVTAGTITVNSITINNQTLSPVAFSNDYNDLDNTPIGFSGSYNDLSNLPFIPTTTRALSDVVNTEAGDGQALLYNSLTGEYEPGDVVKELDLSDSSLGDIGNVITLGLVDNRFLKFTAGAWRPARVQWSEIQNRPFALSEFNNDLDYAEIVGTALENNGLPTLSTQTLDISGSVFADDSALLVDGLNGKIVGNVDTSLVENSSGNLTVNADNYLIINSTNNGQIEIGRDSGLGDVILGNTSNSTDVQIEGRLFIRGGGVPTSSVGSDGDFEGIFAVDNDYIYYCTATFDGVTNIWKRVAWSGDTW